MAHFTIEPNYFAKVRKEQDRLWEAFSSVETEERVCPYCKHKTIRVAKGTKGYVVVKCKKCAEEALYSFRRVKYQMNYSHQEALPETVYRPQ